MAATKKLNSLFRTILSSLCSWALCSCYKLFLARAHGHKTFLYLSGCRLVKSSPAMKAASCLNKSPKIMQIACLCRRRKSSFRQRFILYS